MSKLRIRYVSHVPQCAEELSPDVVELWIRISGTKLDVNIVRRGFMLADPVMLKIRQRVKRLAADTRGIKRPLAERIGFSPELSSEWRQFLDDLLQREDSWSFFVNSVVSGRPC